MVQEHQVNQDRFVAPHDVFQAFAQLRDVLPHPLHLARRNEVVLRTGRDRGARLHAARVVEVGVGVAVDRVLPLFLAHQSLVEEADR